MISTATDSKRSSDDRRPSPGSTCYGTSGRGWRGLPGGTGCARPSLPEQAADDVDGGKGLPEPVAIGMRARGSALADERSRLRMARAWTNRRRDRDLRTALSRRRACYAITSAAMPPTSTPVLGLHPAGRGAGYAVTSVAMLPTSTPALGLRPAAGAPATPQQAARCRRRRSMRERDRGRTDLAG